jgi:hypothetical protein
MHDSGFMREGGKNTIVSPNTVSRRSRELGDIRRNAPRLVTGEVLHRKDKAAN